VGLQSAFGRIRKAGVSPEGRWLAIVLPVIALEWVVFKLLYPYGDYFTDSYSYIGAAVDRDAISYRPIGYSLFLRIVHVLSASDTFLVTLQYALVQGACLGLVLAMRRRCGLSARTVGVLMAFLVLNPLIPYTCNYVSSDALFLGLSIIWFTVLMGLIRDPAWWRLGLQVALLFIIFNLRYVALFYPVVAVLTIFMIRTEGGSRTRGSRTSAQVRGAQRVRRGGTRRGPTGVTWWFRLAGIAGSIGIVAIGVILVKQVTRRQTGAGIFSAFSGWQIANNALNIAPYIDMDTAVLSSPQCRELARMAGAYFEKAGPALRAGPHGLTTAYMWDRSLPLHQYMKVYRRTGGAGHAGYFVAWNRVAPIFAEFGYSLICRHPAAFLHYYCWPSAKGFFLPDLDVFSVYNYGNDTVDAVAKDWFGYGTTKPKVWSATAQGRLLAPMPWVYLLLNIGFVIVALPLLGWDARSRARRGRNQVLSRCFQLAAAFLVANACFCIFASPSVLRYQVVPMILLFVFTVCALSHLINPFFLSNLKVKTADDVHQRQ
jgi:hypothetical protein